MGRDGVIVLAAPRGPLQDGLQAVLSALPQVTRAEHAGDAASTLARVAASRPALNASKQNLRHRAGPVPSRQYVKPRTRAWAVTHTQVGSI